MKHPNDWHLLEKDAVLHALDVDLYKGLSSEDVRQRRRVAGRNTIWHIPRASEWEVARAAFFDLATLLLVISAAAAALFEKSTEAGALVVVLLVGAVLRSVTYIRATRILEDRAKEKIPCASVIRSGKVLLVGAEEIVPGDIVVLEPGDTVPCDGRVITGEDAVVSERGITENKTPVHKFDTVIETNSGGEEVPCEFRSNMLFAGSLMLSGSLRIAATACGEAALISRKQGGILIEAAGKLPAIEKLKIRSKNTSLVMLAFVMVLTALSLFGSRGMSLPDVFLGSMSMAVAAMSEFLTIIGTIMIAVALRDAAKVSAYRSGEQKDKVSARAVIRQVDKIEELQNIGRIVFCGASFFKSGRSELYAYRTKGKYVRFGKTKKEQAEDIEALLKLALAASADSNQGIALGGSSDPNQTEMDALIRRGVDSYTKKTGKPLENTYALYDHKDASDPQTLGMQVSLLAKENDVWAVAVGSVETVLSCCTHAETEEGIVPLTEELRRQIGIECARLAFSGASILALSMRKSPYMKLNRVAVLTQHMTFAGFFAVAEEPEEKAAEHIKALKEAGIVPILFSEKPDTDLYYCHRLGLFNKKTVRVQASALTEGLVDGLDTNGMIVSFENVDRLHMASARAKAMKCIMHDHMTDAKKILPNKEETSPVTAAIGRETWDSGVLAAADVGIAAPRSDVRTVPEPLSRYAATLVYKEHRMTVEGGFGGLGGLMRAMGAAASALGNIENAKSYLTASQTARLVVLTAAVLFGLPLLPAVFILIWGILFDFAAVLMMAFKTPQEGETVPIRGKKSPREALYSVLDGILLGTLLSLWIPFLQILSAVLSFSFTEEEALAVLCGSSILSAAVLAFVKMKGAGEQGRGRVHTAGLLFALAAVLLTILLTFTSISGIGSACCGWKALLTVVPAMLVMLTALIAQWRRKRKAGDTLLGGSLWTKQNPKEETSANG